MEEHINPDESHYSDECPGDECPCCVGLSRIVADLNAGRLQIVRVN